MARPMGTVAPPPMAWSTLADTTQGKFGASATNADPIREQDQRRLEHLDAAVDVGQAPSQWHGHGIADQIRGYDPGRPVQVRKGDFQVHHYAGQRGDYHGLVQGSGEYPQAEYP